MKSWYTVPSYQSVHTIVEYLWNAENIKKYLTSDVIMTSSVNEKRSILTYLWIFLTCFVPCYGILWYKYTLETVGTSTQVGALEQKCSTILDLLTFPFYSLLNTWTCCCKCNCLWFFRSHLKSRFFIDLWRHDDVTFQIFFTISSFTIAFQRCCTIMWTLWSHHWTPW